MDDDKAVSRILAMSDDEIMAGITPEKIRALQAERDAAVASAIAARSDATGWHKDYKQERREKNAALAPRVPLMCEPDNDALRSLGAFDRKCRVGKHQATNWAHLRQTIDTLDAAGHSDAADTLIWVVWHEVNSTARAREYHGIEAQRRSDLERDYHLMCEEDRRLQAGIAELIALCDQDAVDQDHNATLTSWVRRSKPYAIGRGTACKGIASRLRALLPTP